MEKLMEQSEEIFKQMFGMSIEEATQRGLQERYYPLYTEELRRRLDRKIEGEEK